MLQIDPKTYLLESFSLRTRAGILACIAAAFGQKPIFFSAVVAEDYTRRGEVEDGHAGTDGRIGTVPIAIDRRVCLRDLVMVLVQ